ncbi:hypothetical protein MMC24_007043 [Lignoscripta atroalba]|nr:hypothetical protein [Lignoscripta atroalba]
MSSYLTSLLTQTSTHYTSLRRLLPSSSSEEADNNLTDTSDSHVSRVLRAYYIEKGRPFPAWLGPDPREKEKSPTTALSSSGFVGSMRAGGLGGGSTGTTNLQRGNNGPSASGGGLGDLFADSPQAQTSEPESLSLRHRPLASSIQSRSSNRSAVGGGAIRSPGVQQTNSSDSLPQQQANNARLLPSQRAGSYQVRQLSGGGGGGSGPNSSSPSPLPGMVGREASVQERLKARLGGGGSRGASPILGVSSNTNTSTSTPLASSTSTSTSSTNPSASMSSYGATDPRHGNPYNHRSTPSNDRNPYAPPTNTYSTNNSLGAGNPTAATKPYISSSSPWVSGDDSYAGGGGTQGGDYGGGNGNGNGNPEKRRGLLGGRIGLPSGPKMR